MKLSLGVAAELDEIYYMCGFQRLSVGPEKAYWYMTAHEAKGRAGIRTALARIDRVIRRVKARS